MSTLVFSLAAGWPVSWAVLVLLGVVFAGVSLLVSGRRLSRWHSTRAESPSEPAPSPQTAVAPPHTPAASADHRETVRTGGTWVKLVLVDDDADGRLMEGHVVDYTATGVGIMLFQPFPVGKVLRGRHAKAPGDVPWVRLEVRSCHQLEKTIWKLGCHVDDVTLWDTLLRYS